MYGIGYEKSDVKTKRIGSGFKSLTSDSHFPELLENFEHNLGIYAYNHPKAIAAVDRGNLKMRNVLYKYYSDKCSEIKDEDKREQKICLKAFTNDTDPSSECQIGNVSYAQLCKAIDDRLEDEDCRIVKDV